MMENTWYSVISPESCSSILWRSWDKKEQAAEALKLTATDNLRLGIIDGIIDEPMGGAHKNPEQAYQNIREKLIGDLDRLGELSPAELIPQRIAKFSRMGVVEERITQEAELELGKKKMNEEALPIPQPDPTEAGK